MYAINQSDIKFLSKWPQIIARSIRPHLWWIEALEFLKRTIYVQ